MFHHIKKRKTIWIEQRKEENSLKSFWNFSKNRFNRFSRFDCQPYAKPVTEVVKENWIIGGASLGELLKDSCCKLSDIFWFSTETVIKAESKLEFNTPENLSNLIFLDYSPKNICMIKLMSKCEIPRWTKIWETNRQASYFWQGRKSIPSCTAEHRSLQNSLKKYIFHYIG